ncbi:MAG: CpsD/CapB family tyrosine-protein kinase, partial [Acidiferrobacterales bacterium]|nr:CpsD/CapB family tyrosine-protein kinase [Acidiferrobacterales bacterium]
GRPPETRRGGAKVRSRPVLGGLHPESEWAACILPPHDQATPALGLHTVKGLNLAQVPTEPDLTSGQVLDQMCERPFSALSESVRWLHMALRPDHRTESQVIMLTSAIPGEGKSTLSLMLAKASAETGKSTLLIDADRVRTPELRAHAIFVAKPSPRETHGFDIVTAEAIGSVDASGDAVQWLKNDTLCEKVLRKCRTRYQTIIIDAPPALSISDAVILGRAADQVAIVCEWGATPQGSLRQCVHHLRNCGIAPRGVALNKVDLLRQAQETFAGAEYALNRTMSYYADVVKARPDRT